MIAGLAMLLLVQGAGVPQRAATVSARVTPESPAVGEPITIELRVRAPRGTLVRFPVLPDTGSRVEPLDPRSISATSAAGEVDETATYRVIAWDTGAVDLRFGDVTLERDGRTTRYPVRVGAMRIRSVLPPDAALRRPKPAREPLDAPTMPWRWLVALALLSGLGWWGWRRWRRQHAVAPGVDLGAALRARQSFAHLRALDLLSAGETGRHALAHVQVLRRYLAERWPVLTTALTATELESKLPDLEFPILPERVVAPVATSEQLAYAAAELSADAARRLAVDVTAVVEDLEEAWLARQAKSLADARIRRKRLR